MTYWQPFHAIGIVLQSFTDQIDSKLSLDKDQTVVMIEKHLEWYRGYKMSLEGKTHELFTFPCNCIHIISMIHSNDSNTDKEMRWIEWDQMAQLKWNKV